MSDYTPINDFSVKDGLATGNPDKAVLASELQAEFDAIAVAITSKFDENTTVAVTNGGTGATTAATARSNLGYGAAALLSQDFNNLLSDTEIQESSGASQLSNGGLAPGTSDIIIFAFGLDVSMFNARAGIKYFTLQQSSGSASCSPIGDIPGTGNTIPFMIAKSTTGSTTVVAQPFFGIFECSSGGSFSALLKWGGDTNTVFDSQNDAGWIVWTFNGA